MDKGGRASGALALAKSSADPATDEVCEENKETE